MRAQAKSAWAHHLKISKKTTMGREEHPAHSRFFEDWRKG